MTYRTRGGPAVQDAFFSPTTQTPYTDEFQAGYEVDLGHSMSVGATYYKRQTRDIMEDYDLELYATAQDGQIHYPGPTDHPDSLFLGLDYFGYAQNPGSNFVIGTLEGGERNAQGLEFVFRKRFERNWQMLASYNYLDADGNTNSDSNADFQGDVIFLDPRAPNQSGRQPGSIAHLFKTAGSVRVPVRPAARRHVPVELGHGSEPDVPRSRSESSDPRCPQPSSSSSPASTPGGSRPTRWVPSRTRRGVRSTCARSTCTAWAG